MAENRERPFLSVVVPTCHRNDLLALCLDRLAPGKQTLDPALYEVIVSDDGRVATAEGMIAQDFPWVRWVAGPKDGPAANRNNGARHARGEWIAFTDDDCLPDARWLEAVAAAARRGNVDVIEGKTTIPDFVDHPFKQGVQNESGGSFWSCNLAVRRSVFESLGGFDADFKEAADEDMEFAWRFRQRGHAHLFAPEAHVSHPVRTLTFTHIWRRTKMARWHELLYLKRGGENEIDANPATAAARAICSHIVNTARTTWHVASRFDPTRWRTRLFWAAWRWITMPFTLPYIALWRVHFQKMLKERQSAVADPGK